jgi:putative ABC transport system substrate-binding protein
MKRREFISLLGGAAAAWPIEARAQQPGMPVIGFLSSRSAHDSASVEAAFRQGLGETGFVNERNVHMTYAWASGRFDRLPTLAAALVEQQVAVIIAAGGDVVVHAVRRGTTTIPVVFIVGSDPADSGLVASLARPGGNITGVTLYSIVVEEKRLELLRELVTGADIFAMIINRQDPLYQKKRSNAETSARVLGVKLHIFDADTEKEIETAFIRLGEMHARGLLIGTSPFFSARRNQIMALAMRHGVPAIYDSRAQVSAGGLISYGASYEDTYRQAGIYAGRILKGARPADLPVLLPTKFELVINLTTAKALGLKVPDKLLTLADEVIE